MSRTPRGWRRLVAALRLDLSIAVRHLIVDVAAGSAMTPRPLRWLIYRSVGIRTFTMNVFAGVKITGTDLCIGADTFINHRCYLDVGQGRIEIGERCHLAPEVLILTATHDLSSGRASKQARYETTIIGDDVWLGSRTSVLPGVHVAEGCVVAAGSVLTQNTEPRGLYAGVPARRVRDLSPESDPAVASQTGRTARVADADLISAGGAV